MNNKEKREISADTIERAVAGDKEALEMLLTDSRDMVFNLSLRMLGMLADAEDATQEILIKIMTHLSAFRGDSNYSTWVFRIAVNHLLDYKKHMFAKQPLSFEFYGEDIAGGKEKEVPDMSQGIEAALLEEELKLSCTNVMLQCLDKESRCIFILGTMFKLDSGVAGEILGITPVTYRKRLSRIRERMAVFLNEYCGLSGKGICSCGKRIHYAAATHRLNPQNLEYSALEKEGEGMIERCKQAMEKIDDMTFVFSGLPSYRTSPKVRQFIEKLLQSEDYRVIADA